MTATCVECGHVHEGGCVAPWFDIDENGLVVPAEDVSYLCFECDEVTDREIEILDRPG